MEMLVKMAEVLVKIVVMMIDRKQGGESPLLLLLP